MSYVNIEASDGVSLRGMLLGDPQTAQGGIVVAPAMGTPARYYADFAAWLAAEGFAVLVFDYRGIGASRPSQRSLRGFDAAISTWAERDAGAALAWLRSRLPAGTALHWVGHSLGGQIFGMVPGNQTVSSLVTVGCGSGYWRYNAPRLRRHVLLLWHLLVPLALRLFGYFPSRWIGLGQDIPADAMAQWRRWCLHPEYLAGDADAALRDRYAAVRLPILALGFSDDEYLTREGIDALHRLYRNARTSIVHLSPAELGQERIGHSGFFRRELGSGLWGRVGNWLRHAASQQTTGAQDPEPGSGVVAARTGASIATSLPRPA
jgi:predicted alpha/beta hydrolase